MCLASIQIRHFALCPFSSFSSLSFPSSPPPSKIIICALKLSPVLEQKKKFRACSRAYIWEGRMLVQLDAQNPAIKRRMALNAISDV